MRAPKGLSSTVAGSGSHRTLGDGLEGALTWPQIVQAVSNVWNEPWEELLSARSTGASLLKKVSLVQNSRPAKRGIP